MKRAVDPAPFRQPIAAVSPTEQLLLALLIEMRALRVDLARDRQPAAPRRDDARFVAAIATSAQGRVFNAAELVAHGQADTELREALNGRTSRQIGKQLRALVDRPVGGFVVRRIGRDGDGTIWAVQVADLHADAGAAVDPGA